MDQAEARIIPANIAICPICGKGLWIEGIDEVEESGDLLIPTEIALTCETEPDLDSDDWRQWHDGHFSNPYTDWLPIKKKLLTWLRVPVPEQQQRVNAIWNSGDSEQCPECHSFDTAACLTSPDWWRCSVCLNEWESDHHAT